MDNRALGLLEIIAQMGTGGAAEMGGGLAYLGTLPFGGDPAAQAVKNAVQDRFTYQPRTQSARSMMQMVSEYGAPFMQKAGQKLDETADAVYQRTGSPTLGAAVKTAPTALMELSDRINVGGMLKRNKSILGMDAYHSSPHKFDRFDMSKVGTGDGAQAYGHGLYFADSPNFTKEYGENLYTVEIPDEAAAKFLDWDKPISQQPQAVRDALMSSGIYKDDGTLSFMYGVEPESAGDLYERLTSPKAQKITGGQGQEAASRFLNSIGIPGIRHRNSGATNFVVFDDKLVKVLKKE